MADCECDCHLDECQPALTSYPTAWKFRDRPDYCDAIRGIRKPVIAAIIRR